MKAFPKVQEYNISDGSEGMELRDYFAAKAMQGLLSNERVSPTDEFTVKCYRIADAMMKAREQ